MRLDTKSLILCQTAEAGYVFLLSKHMRIRLICLSAVLLSCSSTLFAQLPPPAAPIAEIDIRNNSIKVRQRALEIFKQQSRKDRVKSDKNYADHFVAIKQDFELIQVRQNEIVNIYTRQKIIDYKILDQKSKDLVESSERLRNYLFPDIKEKPVIYESDDESANVPTTIVKMDNALGRFVVNPMFEHPEVLDLKESERARKDLEELIYYSKHLAFLSQQIELKQKETN